MMLNDRSLLYTALAMVSLCSASSSYDYSDLTGQLGVVGRCDARIVYVTRMYLTCDSAGDYYYGSNSSYRQSSRCKYGDKANMHIFFTISNDYAWNGVQITIDSGVMSSFTNVQSAKSLCKMKTLTYLPSSDDDAATQTYCPTPGDYLLEWSFEVPVGDDAQLQYTPDIRINFQTAGNDGTHAQLGCASTGTVATVHNSTLHQKNGFVALGIALGLVFLIFGVCLCMAYRRKKQVEEERKGRALHRYYFARNADTGELVPIPARGWGTPLPPPGTHPNTHHHDHHDDASTMYSNSTITSDHQHHRQHHPLHSGYPMAGPPEARF